MSEERGKLDEAMRAHIAAAPLLFIGSCGSPAGADMSPRGDAPGFVAVSGDGTLLLPDRIGNNRLDTLNNILLNPNVVLVFVVPDSPVTLTVSGRARISLAPAHLAALAVNGSPPRSVLEIEVEHAAMDIASALVAADFWKPIAADKLKALPTLGAILAGQVGGMTTEQAEGFVAESYQKRLY